MCKECSNLLAFQSRVRPKIPKKTQKSNHVNLCSTHRESVGSNITWSGRDIIFPIIKILSPVKTGVVASIVTLTPRTVELHFPPQSDFLRQKYFGKNFFKKNAGPVHLLGAKKFLGKKFLPLRCTGRWKFATFL